MKIYRYLTCLALAATLAVASACNLGATAPASNDGEPNATATQEPADAATAASTDTPSTESTATGAVAAAGACSHPYLPVLLGATWRYKISGPIPDEFTHNILAVDEGGFTEQDAFDSGVTRQGQWQCQNGDLIALNPGNGSSANVSAEGVSVDFQTTELSGVTLPASVAPGDTWNQSITLEGTQTINGTSFPASNHMTSNCEAKGVESVTVPAGTFDALRVECQTDMNISIALDANNPISTPLSLTNVYWYAQDVGLVKNTTTSPGLDATVELISYTLP